MRLSIIVLVLVGTLHVGPLVAQQRDKLEVQVGGGYVLGGGGENPGPSLPVYDVGLAFWLSERWGVAARHVRGPGDDIWGSPVEDSDRIFSGEGNLRYTTVTARRRWFMASGMELNIGFGLMLGGSYEGVSFLKRSGQPPLRLRPETSFGGFALELLVGRKLSRHFGVKVGFTEDFNFDTANTQFVGLAIFSF